MFRNAEPLRRSRLAAQRLPGTRYVSNSVEVSLRTRDLILLLVGIGVVGVLALVAGVIVGADIDLVEARPPTVEAKPSQLEAVGIPEGRFAGEAVVEVEAQVAPPAVVEAPEAAPPPAAESSQFTIQVGAFKDGVRAERYSEVLWSKGYEPYVYVEFDAGGGLWHCVRIGAYETRSKARSAAAQFAEKEKTEAIVRPRGAL